MNTEEQIYLIYSPEIEIYNNLNHTLTDLYNNLVNANTNPHDKVFYPPNIRLVVYEEDKIIHLEKLGPNNMERLFCLCTIEEVTFWDKLFNRDKIRNNKAREKKNEIVRLAKEISLEREDIDIIIANKKFPIYVLPETK